MPLQQGMNQQSPAAVNTILRGKGTSDFAANRGTRRRRRKSATVKRAKRTNGKRKLKFGSPAWRKRYMKKR